MPSWVQGQVKVGLVRLLGWWLVGNGRMHPSSSAHGVGHASPHDPTTTTKKIQEV